MDYQENVDLIDKAAARDDLTTEDILNLTIALRLARLSDSSFAKAMSGNDEIKRRRF